MAQKDTQPMDIFDKLNAHVRREIVLDMATSEVQVDPATQKFIDILDSLPRPKSEETSEESAGE